MLRALLVVVLVLFACRSTPPVETRLLWQSSLPSIVPADLNGDSTDEFLCTNGNYVLDSYSQDLMRCVDSTIYEDSQAFRLGVSITGGSGASGVWYAHVRHDSLLLFSSKARGDLFVLRGRDSLPPAGWDGAASYVAVEDINGDGELEAVVVVRELEAVPGQRLAQPVEIRRRFAGLRLGELGGVR